jgi:hypothetical protein
MELAIKLDYQDCGLELFEKSRSIDSTKFSYYHDLDEKLITYIDKLLKRNKIDINALKSYKIEENMGENATSVRIAETVIQGLKG